jgi:hypothetical protein
MAMTPLRVQIGRVSGCAHRIDSDELSQRVAAELRELLAREPLPRVPAPGTVIRAPIGRIHTGSASTAAGVAHAIARHLHTTLYTGASCQ